MKKHKGLKIFLIIIITLGLFIGIVNIIPPKVNHKENPFISKDRTMLCAHRGGAAQNPENTMKAYKSAAKDYKADILETDLWMTKDEKLVLNHDGKLNRTTDIELFEGDRFDPEHEYKISDFTYKELCQFNFGYQFEINGERPYKDLVKLDTPNREKIIRDNDLNITLIDEFLDYFYKNYPNMLFIIEIKDTDEVGIKATNMLTDLLENKYQGFMDNVIIGTFHPEIEEELTNNHKDLFRGASMKGAATFVITQLLCVNLFDNTSVIAYELPMSQYGINMTMNTFISRAHRKNIAIQYWTINEEEDMRYLIDKGVDAIISDDIALLREVLDSYK